MCNTNCIFIYILRFDAPKTGVIEARRGTTELSPSSKGRGGGEGRSETEVEQQGEQAGQAAVGSHQDSDKDWGGQSPRTGIMRIEGKIVFTHLFNNQASMPAVCILCIRKLSKC